MDRLIQKELVGTERQGADFEALQFHYGRLGAAWSRFHGVPDVNGAHSNISVETAQSLLRVLQTNSGFAASSWLAVMWLWYDKGDLATQIAAALMSAFIVAPTEPPFPRSEEEVLDGWIAASQVFALNNDPDLLSAVVGTAEDALDRAARAGDAVRGGRVAALQMVAYALTTEDLPALASGHGDVFAEVERVGDGLALGMRALALGRWHVGAGGLALAQTAGSDQVANTALEYLQHARLFFQEQGMDAWSLLASIQMMKALADLDRFDECQELTNSLEQGVEERFPILASHFFEAVAQIQLLVGDANAAANLRRAIETAEQSGLLKRRDSLQQYAQAVGANVDEAVLPE